MGTSFAVSIKIKNQKEWARNGLRFSNSDDATAYGAALKLRWPIVDDVVIESTFDASNSTFPVPSDRYPVNRPAALPPDPEADSNGTPG